MIEISRESYTLLLGNNPSEIFWHYGVEQMHGLSYADCITHANTDESAYIWGWSNFVPKDSSDYKLGDARYVFINLQRCSDSYKTYGMVFHEMMHHSLYMHNYNMDLEEEIISWAESESHQVFGLVLDAIKSKTPPGAHYEEA
jgi:hypothetical protein